MAIAIEQTVTGGLGDGGGNSFTLTSWTPGANELVLVAVALRDDAITPTCSGNGLTFVQVAIVDNTQGQNSIALFRAMGASPSTGQITVTVTGNGSPVSAVASRFSDVDTSGTHGSGAVEANATDVGPSPDNDDMKIDITTLTDNAWAFACGTHRSATFSVPGGETGISINNTQGTGGNVTSCSTWYQSVPSASTVTVGADNDLSGATDWCIIAASIKPATTTVSVSESDSVSVSDSATVLVLPPSLPMSTSDSISVSDATTVVAQAPGTLAISVTDTVTVSGTYAGQPVPLLSDQAETVTVTDSATVAIPSTPTDTSEGADDYTLSISDGDWETHLTHDESGFILLGPDGWAPAMARFKGGGYKSVGSLPDGNQLRYTAFDDVIEALRLKLDFAGDETDDMVNQIDMLAELLQVRATRYWTDRRCHSPVWIKRQLKGETGIAYALINKGNITLPNDTWDSCTHTSGRLYPVLITVDRQPFWLGAEPGEVEGAIQSAATQAWDFDYDWGVEDTTPTGYVFAFAEDYDGNIWAAGASEILQWNGSAWSVASTAPVALSGDVEACVRLLNGDVLFGDDGQIVKRSAAGTWSVETSLPTGQITSLLESTTGEVFAGESGQILIRDTAGSWSVDTTLPSGGVWSLEQARTGRVFAGGDNEILGQTSPETEAGSYSIFELIDQRGDNAEQYNDAVNIDGLRGGLTFFNRNYIGLRFTLDIPAGARINTCAISVMLRRNPPDAVGVSENLKVYCEDTDDAAIFTTADSDVSDRTLTTNYVDWQDEERHTRHEWFGPPDLSHVLQEVIDRPGWVSGQHVVFIFKCDNLTWTENLDSGRRCYDHRH